MARYRRFVLVDFGKTRHSMWRVIQDSSDVNKLIPQLYFNKDKNWGVIDQIDRSVWRLH